MLGTLLRSGFAADDMYLADRVGEGAATCCSGLRSFPPVCCVRQQDQFWTNMSPLRGWSTRGERLVAHAPYGHWKTMTFIAALRLDRVEAPWVLNGPINGEPFQAYVETQLVRTLKPGDIVVLDNLGSHKGAMVRDVVRAAGARLFFLPPYSPDFNTIEQLFAKLKHSMRRAAQRSVKTVHNAIANVLDPVTPIECTNYVENAGYRST
ncbi:MAG: IS630 family transposase [Rhizobiaceae bacterium]|nr:MAG: IS630 family transposase [Rhizobiaceae bacterium]